MAGVLDPVLHKELGEAKAALARHGIVIMRGVETELEPAIMVAVRDSLASSPGKLKGMSDDQLDKFMDKVRGAAAKSTKELSLLHTHLLAKLGTEYIADLVDELDGIDQLFRWERIAKASGPVDELLKDKGFRPVSIPGPREVSDAFAVELEEKWPSAFKRFRSLAEDAAKALREEGERDKRAEPKPAKRKKG
ncbi:MAG: hypothetical protein QG582_1122 [Candidatus Thermoplasmatota archaeon]|nr:hypothetical protein [Candidatus Thermoplasmatota archaeon]